MSILIFRSIVLAAFTVSPSIATAKAESYRCQLPALEGADQEANLKPWAVKAGKIVLGYHGDLVPGPPMDLPIVKDNADQLVAMKYIHQPKGPYQTEILVIDKNAWKVNFLLVLAGASYIEHYEGSCVKP